MYTVHSIGCIGTLYGYVWCVSEIVTVRISKDWTSGIVRGGFECHVMFFMHGELKECLVS